MALLPSFSSVDTDDPQRVRARLVGLRSAAGSAPDPHDPANSYVATAEGVPGGPRQVHPDNGTDLPPLSGGGRLVQRWVPGSLRDARWEPGRPGALMLSVVAALAAVVAAIGVWRERPVPELAPVLPLVTAAPKAPSAPPSPDAIQEVVVSVAGRVARPGLVRLPDGTRVADALAAAGGALPGTDLMGLNIARRLSDGEQLLVGVAPPPGPPVDGAMSNNAAATPRTVDLNAATLEQLDGLPGVGPVTAQRILDWRSEHGRFRSVDQLREVSGIGPARLAQLKDLVRV